jgi:hypothetical protein
MAGIMDEDERACIIDVKLIIAVVRRRIGKHRGSWAGASSVTSSGTGRLGLSAIEEELENRFAPQADTLAPRTNTLLFECLSARAKSAEVRGRARDAISELEQSIRQSRATVREMRGLSPAPVQVQSPEQN